jgi:hypothetical protein
MYTLPVGSLPCPYIKSTRQPRLDCLASDGIAQIQLTIASEGNRFHLGTEAVVKPEHWHEELH